MDATTTSFRAATIALLVLLGLTAAQMAVQLDAIAAALRVDAGAATPAGEELKIVDIRRSDARALLARPSGALEQALGLEASDRIVALNDAPIGSERAGGAAIAAAVLHAGADAFFDIDVSRRGRPIRIVVLLHE